MFHCQHWFTADSFVEASNVTSPGLSLTGREDSYIVLDELPSLSENVTTNIFIAMSFSTQSDGLLFWYGKVRVFVFFANLFVIQSYWSNYMWL